MLTKTAPLLASHQAGQLMEESDFSTSTPWKPLQPLGFLICKIGVLHPNSQGYYKEQLRELGKSHSQMPACDEHSRNVVIYTILITRSQQHPRPLADPSAPLLLLPLRLGPLGPKLMHFFPPPMIGC